MPTKTIYEKDGWDEKLAVIQGWARDGLIDKQIANNMGIHVATLYEYKKKYPEFNEALKKEKEVVDYEVENAMLKRALGYDYEEIKVIITDKGSKSKRIEKTTKHVMGDVTAEIIWLKNRKPASWRDRPQNEEEAENKLNEVIAAMMEAADN